MYLAISWAFAIIPENRAFADCKSEGKAFVTRVAFDAQLIVVFDIVVFPRVAIAVIAATLIVT